MIKFKTLRLSQLIRVVVNGTAQFLTVKQARDQFLDSGAMVEALCKLDSIRELEDIGTMGMLGNFKGRTIQIDIY